LLQVLVTLLLLKFPHFVGKSVIMEISNEKILKQFGKHVKQLRKEIGLSQDDIVLNARKITKGTVSDIENGKRNLSFTTLMDLAKGMKIHPKALFDFEIE